MSSLQPAHKGILILFGIALVFFYVQKSSYYSSSFTLNQRTKVHRRCVTPRTIALTYDDNPNEGIYDLLTLLKSYNATATFFPNAPHHYNTLKLDKYIHDAHAAGHQIGIHTWDHINLDNVGHKEALDNIWNMDTLDWIFGTDDKFESSIEIIKHWSHHGSMFVPSVSHGMPQEGGKSSDWIFGEFQAGLQPQHARAGPWYNAESNKFPPISLEAIRLQSVTRPTLTLSSRKYKQGTDSFNFQPFIAKLLYNL
ncbi:hypothetical protein DER44DRAFT_660800 [Fusarium oxysporum]|nr:hypothetical protein DER44DRAFT_660800 [Fusarium oxysporum]